MGKVLRQRELKQALGWRAAGGAEEMRAGSDSSEPDPVRHHASAGLRREEPGGRGAVPGGARGCPGRGERPWGSGESAALRQADLHRAASPAAVPPCRQRVPGLEAPLPPGRLPLAAVGWGCPAALGGTSERVSWCRCGFSHAGDSDHGG